MRLRRTKGGRRGKRVKKGKRGKRRKEEETRGISIFRVDRKGKSEQKR